MKKKKKRVAPVSGDEPARKRVAEAVLPSAQETNNFLLKKPAKDKPTIESGVAGVLAVTAGLGGIGSVSAGVAANKKKRKKNEVIDYSATQTENEAGGGGGDNADPKSKVRSWLLASQCRIDQSSSNGLPKSKSTPVGLTNTSAPGRGGAVGAAGRVRQVTLRRLTDPKARSAGSLARNDPKNDRVRLQVVYKPPFKFSVKLRKADKVGQINHGNHAPAARNNAGPRTGVLVRTGAKKKDRVRIAHGKQTVVSGAARNNNSGLQEPANSDLHTVPSDLEVLLSESEFLFSDA